MAVTFTPNIGLAKPTESEVAENWVNVQKLQEDNNIIITDKMEIDHVAYTPTIVAQTTPPNLGTGTITGEYQDFQGFVFGQIRVAFFDAGITSGSGEYGFKLPFPVDPVYHVVGTALNNGAGLLHCIGEGYIFDNSSINNSGSVAIDAVTVAGVSYARLVTESFVGKTLPVFGGSMPFALANNDRFILNFLYKKV